MTLSSQYKVYVTPLLETTFKQIIGEYTVRLFFYIDEPISSATNG